MTDYPCLEGLVCLLLPPRPWLIWEFVTPAVAGVPNNLVVLNSDIGREGEDGFDDEMPYTVFPQSVLGGKENGIRIFPPLDRLSKVEGERITESSNACCYAARYSQRYVLAMVSHRV